VLSGDRQLAMTEYGKFLTRTNPIPEIQVCFVMDCNASMGQWIEEARTFVLGMAKSLKQMSREQFGLSVEFSFVCYRDSGGSNNIEVQPFTANIERFNKFIGRVEAKSVWRFREYPKDIAGGFNAAMNLEWKDTANTNKFLVLVANSPCHGSRFHSGWAEFYPDGCPSGMPDRHLHKMGMDDIQLIFVKINAHTDQMIREFRKIYEIHGKKIKQIDLSAVGTSGFESLVTNEVDGHVPLSTGLQDYLGRARGRGGVQSAAASGRKEAPVQPDSHCILS